MASTPDNIFEHGGGKWIKSEKKAKRAVEKKEVQEKEFQVPRQFPQSDGLIPLSHAAKGSRLSAIMQRVSSQLDSRPGVSAITPTGNHALANA